MMKNKLLKIIRANIFYLLLVASVNLILPRYTSVEVYAAVKRYSLYIITYAVVCTLGYTQGVFLKYGGKDVDTLSPAEVGTSVASFFVFLLPMSAAVLLIGLLRHNTLCTFCGVGIMAYDFLMFYQTFYQATGDFRAYGKTLNISKITVLLVYLALIFVFRSDSMILFVGAAPAVDMLTAIYLTLRLNKRIPIFREARISLREMRDDTGSGFFLMAGDFAANFFSNIDRLFVNYLMNTFSFALYSFACSMENLVVTLMTPITVSMFSYFCTGITADEIRRIKDMSLIYAMIVIAAAFPAKLLIRLILPQYIGSADVVFLLFAAQGVGAVIRGIYVNKYKAEGRKKEYIIQILFILALAAVLDALFYYVFRTMVAIASATLITNIVWLIWCESKDRQIRFGVNSAASLCILIGIYLFAGMRMSAVSGFIVYCASGLIVGMLLMRERFSEFFKGIAAGLRDFF